MLEHDGVLVVDIRVRASDSSCMRVAGDRTTSGRGGNGEDGGEKRKHEAGTGIHVDKEGDVVQKRAEHCSGGEQVSE